MHCEVAEALSDKRPKEAPGAPGHGPSGLGAHMAFRVTANGGACGDGGPRDLLSRPPAPPPRAHDLFRARSPRDYSASKVAVSAAGKGESGPACAPGLRVQGDSGRRALGELGSVFISLWPFGTRLSVCNCPRKQLI